MSKSISEVMEFLENHALAWHHWLLLLSLIKLGGCGTRAQIAPVYKREGFSSPTIKQIMGTDIEELGEALKIDGSLDDLADDTKICLNEDPDFRKFIKKNIKGVVSSFRTRKK